MIVKLVFKDKCVEYLSLDRSSLPSCNVPENYAYTMYVCIFCVCFTVSIFDIAIPTTEIPNME